MRLAAVSELLLVGITAGLCPPASTQTVPPSRRHSISRVALSQVQVDLADESFSAWLQSELSTAPNYHMYPDVYADAQVAIVRWRQRYLGTSPRLWKSLMKADRILKELIEAAPVISAVRAVVDEATLSPGERFSIVDLCCGKGFLSMFLSEMLDPQKVERCFLVDKAWPPLDWPHEQPILPHHISDAHIYAERGAEPQVNYFTSWPVPLHTSKQDLKRVKTLRAMGDRFVRRSSGPLLVLGVHLCGTLRCVYCAGTRLQLIPSPSLLAVLHLKLGGPFRVLTFGVLHFSAYVPWTCSMHTRSGRHC